MAAARKGKKLLEVRELKDNETAKMNMPSD